MAAVAGGGGGLGIPGQHKSRQCPHDLRRDNTSELRLSRPGAAACFVAECSDLGGGGGCGEVGL